MSTVPRHRTVRGSPGCSRGHPDAVAGAAEDLEEALIVNPYNIDEMAENLQRALKMPLAERRRRQRALMKRVRERDADNWQSSFLEALEAVPVKEAA